MPPARSSMTIARSALDSITTHARRETPRECCGVLLGVAGRIVTAVAARNVAAQATRFELDPRDHIAARRQARAAHHDVIGFYHSHPHSPPQPSETDVAEWSYPEAMTLIVSLQGPQAEARLFRNGVRGVEEVTLRVECDRV